MTTRIKKHRDALHAKIVNEFRQATGAKTVEVDRLSQKYHVSVSTVYNCIRKAKRHD